MEKINLSDTYKTRDLAEAGALVTKNQQLLRLDRDGKTCWFIFENKKKCEELSNQFFFGELLLNARNYYEALTRLKNRIFST